VKDKIMTYDDIDMPVIVEVERSPSRRLSEPLVRALRSLCRSSGRAEGQGEEEEL